MRRFTGRLMPLGLLLGLAIVVLLSPISMRGLAGGQPMFCLGFILLFGYYLAHALERFRLPSITSYILTGIVCGPFVLNLLDSNVVGQLQVFDDIALSIIALIAGGELKLSTLRRRAPAIGGTIVGQIVFSFVGAGIVVWCFRGSLGGFPLETGGGFLAVALLFGLITVARSPSTTIGVITEARAAGPVTELLIGVTVLLDVLVLVLAALVVPVAETLSAASAALSFETARHLAVEVSGSLVAGLAFGAIVGTYIRWVGGYLPVFLLGIGLIGSSVCRFYHLEPLLAFMIAGFVVENFTVMGDRLIRGLERSAFPVYVVFFAISGASIDLSALASTWGLAGALVLARAAAFFAGGWSASRIVPSLRPFAGSIWSGYLAQAGVTIGIAALIERRFDWGGGFKTVVLAVVAINQLVGPISLKWLLDRKGETGAMDDGAPPRSAQG